MKRGKVKSVAPEWSYPVEAAGIGGEAAHVRIEAGPEERAALARRYGVPSIESLRAELSLARERGGRIVHVQGRLLADLTQSCVVTADPVQSHIEEEVEGWFADPDQAVSLALAKREREKKVRGDEEAPVMDEKEDPEPIIDGLIDLGELTAQFLSLAIDPYPHKQGVGYEFIGEDMVSAPSARRNPFAALKDWKARRGVDEES